ncbi:MAG: hypothetical protein KDC38_06985, partial [Planctomycetes bacterium]|nr:hypothetical protein [Planctomycetota bacterium]
LPVLAHPAARSVLVVGLGGGIALAGIPSSVETIDVIELEPKVVEANAAISDRRAFDPLRDPRVRMIINDGRNALSMTRRKYDVIISQPSHPWSAGASHLYTREFMEQARAHLAEGGIFVQAYVDMSVVGIVGATLSSVFSQTRLYRLGSLIYIAADRPLELEAAIAATGEPLASDPEHYGWLGINSVEDVLACLTLDHEGVVEFSAGIAENTDDRNVLATSAPYRATRDARVMAELEARLRGLDPLLRRLPELPADIAWDQVVARIVAMGFPERAAEVASRIPDPLTRRLAEARRCGWLGQGNAAKDQLDEILRQEPENDAAWTMRAITEPAGTPPRPNPESLSAGSKAVLLGIQAVGRKDWSALADLDADLARVPPNHVAFPSSLELRVRWRVARSGGRDQVAAQEALRLVDRLVALLPGSFPYHLRIDVGFATRRPDVVVETVSALASLLRDRGAQLDETKRKSIVELSNRALDQVAKDGGSTPARLAEVRARVLRYSSTADASPVSR